MMSTPENNSEPEGLTAQDKVLIAQDKVLTEQEKLLMELTTKPNMVLLSNEKVMIVYNTATNKLIPYWIKDDGATKCSKQVAINIATNGVNYNGSFPMNVLGYHIALTDL